MKISNNNVVSMGLVVLVVMAMLATQVHMSQAVTCNPSELASCAPAITSGAPPSSACCAKLRQQKPCLCGYLKNPSLRQYVNSPGARKTAATCGIPIPKC